MHHVTQKKQQKGFTLIEMIIVLSIFVLIVLIVVNVFVIINNTQRKTVAMQKVQDDVRFLFEAMAQEIRLGTINYEHYDSMEYDLHQDDTENEFVLALVNQAGEHIFFRRSPESGVHGAGDKVQYCSETTAGVCDEDTGTGWQDVTPESVEVTDLHFVITPSADPTEDVVAIDCSTSGDADCDNAGLYSYRCDSGVDDVCKYYTDGGNFQPKVRMVFRAQSNDRRISESQRRISIQSTISSRIMAGKVINMSY